MKFNTKPTPNKSQNENMKKEKQMVFSKQNFKSGSSGGKNIKTR